MLKSLQGLRFTGKVLANYFKFVTLSSRMIGSMEPHFAEVEDNLPAIFTFWHGEQFLIPTVVAGRLPLCALVSRNRDGEIQAAALESFGVQTIRGSGGRNRARTISKGGVQSSLEILSALETGISTCMTANVPHGPARKVGKGVIALAKFSGRPIYPVSHVTSKNMFIDSWDKAAINLPFSKAAFILGKPLWVDCAADKNALEDYRQNLEKELLRITVEAQRLVGVTRNRESN
ncbi:MAG: lysophospholipid acyltransferase family protein [Hyphomicrobiales bacterium]